jgi:SAM-dependent methyltransferase
MHKNNQKNNADGRDGMNASEQAAPLFPLAKELSLEEIIERVRRKVLRPDMHGESRTAIDQPEPNHGEADDPAGYSSAIVSQNPELSLEEIMRRVQEEVRRRRNVSVLAVSQPQVEHTGINGELPRWESYTRPLPVKKEYVLGDFLQFSDTAFVDSVYRSILCRPADASGRGRFLAALRAGHLSKVEVLGLIRFSEEGKRRGIHVDGLLVPYKLHQWRRVRVIGPVLAFAMAVIRLPRLVRHLQTLENTVARESHGIGRLINRIDDVVESRLAEIDNSVDIVRTELLQSITARVNGLQSIIARTDSLQILADAQGDELREYKDERKQHDDEFLQRLEAQDSAVSRLDGEFVAYRTHREHHDDDMLGQLKALKSVTSGLGDEFRAYQADTERREHEMLQKLEVQDSAAARVASSTYENRRSILDIQRRLMTFLDVAAKQVAGPTVSAPEGDTSAIDGILNAQYVSFEDEFRGEREDIKTRAAHYLGTLAAAGVEQADGVVLDLGCGRGEWLELLTERGYTCRGVDLNNVMLEDSLARGFDVVEADAVEFLRGLADDSLAAITSMHLVEHLPYNVLIRLLDEAIRVLRPGGVLILETPNPENITVGSCWFYLDPTHRNPIPPDLLQWTVRARGFSQPVIERLSEHRGVPDIQPVSEDVPGALQINLMAAWFTTAPDYAVIARKPSSVQSVTVELESK